MNKIIGLFSVFYILSDIKSSDQNWMEDFETVFGCNFLRLNAQLHISQFQYLWCHRTCITFTLGSCFEVLTFKIGMFNTILNHPKTNEMKSYCISNLKIYFKICRASHIISDYLQALKSKYANNTRKTQYFLQENFYENLLRVFLKWFIVFKFSD